MLNNGKANNGLNTRTVFCSYYLSLMMLVIVGMAGCDRGPKLVSVSGKVFIDGKPLTKGFIQVIPEGQRASTGDIDSEGKFVLSFNEDKPGCVLGEHKVAIISNESPTPNSLKWLVPQKYSNVETSGLFLDVQGPIDNAEIKLSWDGDKSIVEKFESEGTMPQPIKEVSETNDPSANNSK